MIIKYDDVIYASWEEDCYGEDDVADIEFLLGDMECNNDIDTFKVTHYMVGETYIGSGDDPDEVLDNLVEQHKYGYSDCIEVIKE